MLFVLKPWLVGRAQIVTRAAERLSRHRCYCAWARTALLSKKQSGLVWSGPAPPSRPVWSGECRPASGPVRSRPVPSGPARSGPAPSSPIRSGPVRPVPSGPVRPRQVRPRRPGPAPSRPVQSRPRPVRSRPAPRGPTRSGSVPSRPVRSRTVPSGPSRSRPSRPVRSGRSRLVRSGPVPSRSVPPRPGRPRPVRPGPAPSRPVPPRQISMVPVRGTPKKVLVSMIPARGHQTVFHSHKTLRNDTRTWTDFPAIPSRDWMATTDTFKGSKDLWMPSISGENTFLWQGGVTPIPKKCSFGKTAGLLSARNELRWYSWRDGWQRWTDKGHGIFSE